MTTKNDKARWKANTAARRARLIAEGGRNLQLTLNAEDTRKLDELVAYRRKKDPGFSNNAWVRSMLERDHKEMKRLTQRGIAKKLARAGAHSTEPSTP